MFKKLLLVGMLAWVSPAWAKAEVTTMGVISCGEWVENYKQRKLSAVFVDHAWLVGFLSGLAVGSNLNFLANADGNSISVWIGNYCQDHPLDGLDMAAVKLASKLLEGMPKK